MSEPASSAPAITNVPPRTACSPLRNRGQAGHHAGQYHQVRQLRQQTGALTARAAGGRLAASAQSWPGARRP